MVNIEWTSEDVEQARRSILGRITERIPPKELVGLEEQEAKIHDLLERTVSRGESNSVLLIGQRGSGKSMLVNRVLKSLTQKYHVDHKRDFYQVHLNGLVQTDDRIALKEIIRQLSLEQEFDSTSSSSFAETLTFLLNLLKQGSKDNVSIVFILDEFDLFAQHPKQTLLYNLFDVAQSSQNPVAVVGLTCRLDSLELLEKRVKSRFSHRQVLLFPPETFREFLIITRNALELGEEVTNAVYRENFNESLDDVLNDPNVSKSFRRIFDLTKDIRAVFRICIGAVSSLSSSQPFLSLEDLYDASLQQRADSKTELLKGLSLLELCLIIAMKQLLELELYTFNFEMAYNEYKEFMNLALAQGGGGMKLYKKAVAMKAFENLISVELVQPVENYGKSPKEYRMMKVMLEPLQIADAVLKYRDCPTLVRKWGTKWLE
ncbi:origin recognition complex subunit 4 [Basidiobolus ranarum]|uniref:Origin recognition complex subunit 4 n=1 Tax=Basidiobolus ranarum TaxID=34480 RepID=A0ABR2WQ28_9FUNG